jgi:EAL domain-containing protein (putative c-di-GMP-specific phosphodiesterase class I)
MELQTIAEGVSRCIQVEVLKDIGCFLCQGLLFENRVGKTGVRK